MWVHIPYTDQLGKYTVNFIHIVIRDAPSSKTCFFSPASKSDLFHHPCINHQPEITKCLMRICDIFPTSCLSRWGRRQRSVRSMGDAVSVDVIGILLPKLVPSIRLTIIMDGVRGIHIHYLYGTGWNGSMGPQDLGTGMASRVEATKWQNIKLTTF